MKMAREVTEIFYGVEAAQRAEDNFISVFQKGSLPDEMPEYMIKAGQTVLDVLLEGNLAGSKSEGRRLLEQKGVRLDGVTLTDANQVFPHPGVLQAGKRKYLRVISK